MWKRECPNEVYLCVINLLRLFLSDLIDMTIKIVLTYMF